MACIVDPHWFEPDVRLTRLTVVDLGQVQSLVVRSVCIERGEGSAPSELATPAQVAAGVRIVVPFVLVGGQGFEYLTEPGPAQ
jgi:hypothetical protein